MGAVPRVWGSVFKCYVRLRRETAECALSCSLVGFAPPMSCFLLPPLGKLTQPDLFKQHFPAPDSEFCYTFMATATLNPRECSHQVFGVDTYTTC